ncbi:hypothetical protein CEXT_415141 [Caerostris extrusa]|uniref:Uncharacterized protein n=1 Tax=Caerostris extrusa TaxID=172846 RepID=A0AAV4NVB7_CAEEX|nr:hypothetical protein CEXT_415141 [Caerostris extrusa]
MHLQYKKRKKVYRKELKGGLEVEREVACRSRDSFGQAVNSFALFHPFCRCLLLKSAAEINIFCRGKVRGEEIENNGLFLSLLVNKIAICSRCICSFSHSENHLVYK